MAVVRFLWYTLCVIVLFIAISIVIVGGLWILRVAVQFWLDIDYVERLKVWIETKQDQKDGKSQ